jgi:hypothetical protein
MTMTVYSNNLVSIDDTYVGRVKNDSFQLATGIRGKTTFFTAKDGDHMDLSVPHEIDVPLHIPSVPGSVSDWKINPAFEAAVRAIVAL